MNILIKVLPHSLHAFVRKAMLAELFKATANAFACPPPEFEDSRYDERLQAYALFTRDQAEKALRARRDLPVVRKRLYENSYPLGLKVRKWFAVNSTKDVMEIGQILYGTIEVKMQGDALGNMVINHCYFSQFYSPAVCDLISSLDDGIFSGLSAGGRLVFSQRMTEGCECCKARLPLVERGTG
jgi:hypothetical protein